MDGGGGGSCCCGPTTKINYDKSKNASSSSGGCCSTSGKGTDASSIASGVGGSCDCCGIDTTTDTTSTNTWTAQNDYDDKITSSSPLLLGKTKTYGAAHGSGSFHSGFGQTRYGSVTSVGMSMNGSCACVNCRCSKCQCRNFAESDSGEDEDDEDDDDDDDETANQHHRNNKPRKRYGINKKSFRIWIGLPTDSILPAASPSSSFVGSPTLFRAFANYEALAVTSTLPYCVRNAEVRARCAMNRRCVLSTVRKILAGKVAYLRGVSIPLDDAVPLESDSILVRKKEGENGERV
jgi:hypothetical protein